MKSDKTISELSKNLRISVSPGEAARLKEAVLNFEKAADALSERGSKVAKIEVQREEAFEAFRDARQSVNEGAQPLASKSPWPLKVEIDEILGSPAPCESDSNSSYREKLEELRAAINAVNEVEENLSKARSEASGLERDLCDALSEEAGWVASILERYTLAESVAETLLPLFLGDVSAAVGSARKLPVLHALSCLIHLNPASCAERFYEVSRRARFLADGQLPWAFDPDKQAWIPLCGNAAATPFAAASGERSSAGSPQRVAAPTTQTNSPIGQSFVSQK